MALAVKNVRMRIGACVLAFWCAVVSTVFGQATVGTTASNADTFWSGDQVYGHCAAGHYWLAYFDGTRPHLYSSPDAVTWTQQTQLFTTFDPTTNSGWAVHFSGNNVIAGGYNAGDTVRYYRNGTLNTDGTVTWTGIETSMGFSGVSWNELNVRIVNDKPILWRAGAGASQRGRFRIGSQLTGPVWADTTGEPPAVTLTSGGGYSEGGVFPIPGSDPNDLMVLRFTTNFSHIAGRHRLISVKYDASADPDPYEAAWYNVSTLGGGLTESATTEVFNTDDDSIHEKTATVMDHDGNIHAVYVNRNIELVHYMKTPGFNDNWSRISTNVAAFTDIRKVSLGSDHSGVYVFYAKPDSRVYWRRFDGVSWGAESIVKNTTTFLSNPPAPIKLGGNCGMGVAWVEETGVTDTVLFSLLGGGTCTPLVTSETASTVTVTGAGAFEMTFDTTAGGAIQQFYDLAEDPSKTHDLVGASTSSPLGLHNLGMRVGGPFYNSSSNEEGSRLHVLEATPARVRVRSQGFLEESNSDDVLDGVQVHTDHTIYPSGKMAVHWDRRVMVSLPYTTEYLEMFLHWTNGSAPLDGWTIHRQGGGGTGAPGTDDFLLAQIEAAGARTDFLNVLADDWITANGHRENADIVSWAFNVGSERVNPDWIETTGGTHVPAGADNWYSETWNHLTYFTQKGLVDELDVNVTSRSSDYRSPDSLSVTVGSPWQHASENTGGGDDFNESEGAYALTLDPAVGQGLTFDIDGGATTRYSPIFKIRQWRSFQTPSVSLEGTTLANGVDFRSAVKPFARAHFADDLMWHSTLESSGAVTSPDVGSAGTVNNGSDFPNARFGRGARFDTDGEYLTVPAAASFDPNEGSIELWYQPGYDYGGDLGDVNDDFGLFGYFNDNDNYVDAYHEPYQGGAGTGDGLTFRIEGSGTTQAVSLGAGPSFPEYWRAFEWVHLRFVWQLGSTMEVYVNGQLEGSTAYTTAVPPAAPDVLYIGERNRNAVPDNNAEGIIDEFRIYNSASAPTALAHGGLGTDSNEYLASPGRNISLPFAQVDGDSRGEYFYLGSDSQFRGLNVALATFGVGTADLAWEYWNGTQWADLESGFSFTDATNNLTRGGVMHWTDPAGWSVYAVNGSPELYYIRAHVASGSYTTAPVEAMIRTDLLVFQYCGDITTNNQTFVFSAPEVTAVELESFDAVGVDGAVELAWRTASELDNLGFHVYRASSREGPFTRLTSRPIPGLGSSPAGASYGYIDSGLVNGDRWFYVLEDVDASGQTTRHGPVDATATGSVPPSEPIDGDARIELGTPSDSRLTVVRRTGRRVVLELTTEGFEAVSGEDGAVRISVPGYGEADSVALPVKSLSLDAVPGKNVRIASVRPLDVESFPGLVPENAPTVELVADSSGAVRAKKRRGRRAVQADALVPDRWARVASLAYQGPDKKARIELAPIRWDAVRGELVLAKRLRVVVVFDGKEPNPRRKAPAKGAVAHLVTRDSGIYGVSYEDVFGSRRRALTKLALRRDGEDVSFHIEPSGRGFAPGSTLYFESEGALLNPFGMESVYQLVVGEAGRRMPVVSRAPTGAMLPAVQVTERYEVNQFYQAGLVDADDLWLGDFLLAPVLKTYPFTARDLTTGAATLTVALQGTSDFGTSEDHHVRVLVNGLEVGSARWDGKQPHTIAAELPRGLLANGVNELAIENVGTRTHSTLP